MADEKDKEGAQQPDASGENIVAEVKGLLKVFFDKIDKWLGEGKTPRLILASVATAVLYFAGKEYGDDIMARGRVYSGRIKLHWTKLQEATSRLNKCYFRVGLIVAGIALLLLWFASQSFFPGSGQGWRTAMLYVLFLTIIPLVVVALTIASIGNGMSASKDGKEKRLGAGLRSTARNIGIVVWIVLIILGFASLSLSLGRNFFSWLLLVSIVSLLIMTLGTITNKTSNTMFYLGTIALTVGIAFYLLELDVCLGLREKPAIFSPKVAELAIYKRRGLSGSKPVAANDSTTVKEYLVDRSDSFKPKNGERLIRVTWREKDVFTGAMTGYAPERAFDFGDGGLRKQLTKLRGSTGKSPANDQPPTRATITIPEPADIKSFKAYTVALKRGATVRTNVVPPAGSQVRFIQSSQDSCIAGMARAKPTKIVGSEELSFPTNYYNDPLEITSLSGDRTLEFHVF